MEKEIYTLKVYNTLTKQYEDTAVTKEVYDEYKRSEWRIEKSNTSFYSHETLLSFLLEESNENSEEYYQLSDVEKSPENILFEKMQSDILHQALLTLSGDELEFFESLVFAEISESEYAVKNGITQQGVNKKKQKIRKKLKKLLENRL